MKKRYCRTSILRGIDGGVGSIDRKNNVIRGMSVISTGEAQGHNIEIDQITLNKIVELGNSSKIGIKSRFGHPNMSGSAVGTHLGRVKNFRVDDDRVRGDLHISDVAFESPKGDLATYVFNLAESDPDAFGSSIVFPISDVEPNDEETGLKSGDGVLMDLARPTQLNGVDIVDDPATGDGFFESFLSESVQLSAAMTDRLDEFLKDPNALENINSFIDRYISNNEHKSQLKSKLERMVDMKNDDTTNKDKFQLVDDGQKEPVGISEAVALERAELAAEEALTRVKEIYATCDELKLGKVFADELVDDKKMSLSDARLKMINKAKEVMKGLSSVDTTVEITADERDKKVEGMSNAFLVRANLERDSKIIDDVRKSEFNNMTIQNLAKQTLMDEGVTGSYMFDGNQLYNEMMGRFSMFAQAPTQTSGDFVNVLSNVLNKSAGMGWKTANATFDAWVGTGTSRDFKTHDQVRLSEMGDVQRIREGEAPEMANMSDTKEQTRLQTKGTKFILSRQAMVNDDLSMLTTVAARQMRALKRQMNKDCYNLIYNDNGSGTAFLGPTMNEDSATMFNATAETTAGGHNNYSTTNSGPTQALLNTGFLSLRRHRALTPDDSRSEPIFMNIDPRFIIISAEHQLATYKLMQNIGYNVSGEDSAAQGTVAVNIHGPGGPRNLEIVVDAEIDNLSTAYYPYWLATDARDIGTVTLYTLNGNTTPYTASAPTPTGDARGMIWVIEHDYRFAVPDWRGMYCYRGSAK